MYIEHIQTKNNIYTRKIY